jgi:hypothetical protein
LVGGKDRQATKITPAKAVLGKNLSAKDSFAKKSIA